VYLGFGEYDAAKVMGLAAYGDPNRFAAPMERLFTVRSGAKGPAKLPFQIDPALARFRAGDVAGLESLFGPQRRTDEPPESSRFADVAAALQQRTEEALLAVCHQLAQLAPEQNLAYAGGVALNCVANARIERDGPFRNLYVLGAAHDAGTAQGAALEVSRQLGAPPKRSSESLTPFLGPQYDDAEIATAIRDAGAAAEQVADPASRAAALIAEGAVVGWFQGRLELGPRALGHRSLLADPRRAGMRDELNKRIKHREPFRPFAGSILAEDVCDWFRIPNHREGARSSRALMLVTYPVCPARAASIPAVLHCDGTCRLQVVDRDSDPLYHRLLTGFRELTGIPMVLNTSFNDQEPIVCSPRDALATFAHTQIDALFLGDYLIRRDRETVR
jgi:carbamoyltransferase